MKNLFSFPLLCVACGIPTLFAGAAPVAKKPTNNSKITAKPRLIREVMGTHQLLGYEGALGQTFTVGKATAVNFTLTKAVYSAGRINIGQYGYLPSGDEKFLILHFTVQNPLQRALKFTPSYLTLSAVDAAGVTRAALTDIGQEATQQSVDYELKPGQKIELYTAIRVAAWGEVPKLIVQNRYDEEAPIVRYDLRGKVAKLSAPFNNPSDPKSVTAAKIVPAQMGTFYPVTERFDVRLDAISYSYEPMRGAKPETGQRFCVATVTIVNRALQPVRYAASHFNADLKDGDGEKMPYNGELRKASRDEDSSTELAPGETARARFYWLLPAKVEAQTVLLRYGYDKESRTYAIEVGTKK